MIATLMRDAFPRTTSAGGWCVLMCMLWVSCAPYGMSGRQGRGADDIIVRVLIDKTRGRSVIDSERPMRIISHNGSTSTARGAIVLDAQSTAEKMVVEPGAGPLRYNGAPYRGSIEIRPSEGKILVINRVTVREYLMSVVPGEIPSKWGREALKAQAVAARTYCYNHLYHADGRHTLYDLSSTTDSQVYRGMSVETPETTEAVVETDGEIMTYGDRPIVAYFHSTCGGKTSDAKFVWEHSDLPYLRSVECGYCTASPKFVWETSLSREEIRAALTRRYPNISSIKGISLKKKHGRVVAVSVRHSRGTLILRGNEFRLLFQPDRIKSLMFSSRVSGRDLNISGRGWGHGVGMCQWGAKGMAERGFSYREILAHYYTGVNLSGAKAIQVAHSRERVKRR